MLTLGDGSGAPFSAASPSASMRGALRQAVPVRECCCRRPIVATDLVEDVRHMMSNGVRAQHQRFRDLAVGVARSHEPQHLELSGAQSRRCMFPDGGRFDTFVAFRCSMVGGRGDAFQNVRAPGLQPSERIRNRRLKRSLTARRGTPPLTSLKPPSCAGAGRIIDGPIHRGASRPCQLPHGLGGSEPAHGSVRLLRIGCPRKHDGRQRLQAFGDPEYVMEPVPYLEALPEKRD